MLDFRKKQKNILSILSKACKNIKHFASNNEQNYILFSVKIE